MIDASTDTSATASLVSTMRTSSSCYWHCQCRATGSAAARVIGSSFPCLCFSTRLRAFALDPDKVAALRNGHIGRGRRRGGGSGGESAYCERPVNKDVCELSGDDYNNVDVSAARNQRSLGIGGDSPCAPRGNAWVTNCTVALQRRMTGGVAEKVTTSGHCSALSVVSACLGTSPIPQMTTTTTGLPS